MPGQVVEETYIDILKAVKAGGDDSRRGEVKPVLQQFRQHGQAARRGGRERPGAVQPLLPAGHRTRNARSEAEHFVEHADGHARAAAVDCAAAWPAQRESRGHQRHPSRRRRVEDPHGRRGRNHALLGAHPARRPADQHDRERPRDLAGGTRIRLRAAIARQLEPEELRRPVRLRAAQYMRAISGYAVQPPR